MSEAGRLQSAQDGKEGHQRPDFPLKVTFWKRGEKVGLLQRQTGLELEDLALCVPPRIGAALASFFPL
jgi:hypothetical protein